MKRWLLHKSFDGFIILQKFNQKLLLFQFCQIMLAFKLDDMKVKLEDGDFFCFLSGFNIFTQIQVFAQKH